jgi:D-glycero-alpha-D-manno-heptose-7-phosphate kinase
MPLPDPNADVPGHADMRRYVATAPVRTADIGGWTDTWFAEFGLICNVAIDQRAMVAIDHQPDAPRLVTLIVRFAGHRDTFVPGNGPGRHPILEAAVAALAPPGTTVIDIADTNEPGSGLGSSAAVMVALMGALLAASGGTEEPNAIAALAHRVETSTGKESGVQDHVAAVFGGISRIEIDYPDAVRSAVRVDDATLAGLSARLHTISFGRPHVSGPMHEQVIARLAAEPGSSRLDAMRDAAFLAVEALEAGDLDGYGDAMVRNHEAMRAMHPALVSADAAALVEVGQRFGARGWKVNGAGGEGGSMVVLGPDDAEADAAFLAAIGGHGRWRLVDHALAADGLRVVSS